MPRTIFQKSRGLFVLLILLETLGVSCTSSHTTTNSKTIKATEILKMIENKEDVYLVNKTILGDLDFTTVSPSVKYSPSGQRISIQSNLYFEKCRFEGSLIGFRQMEEIRRICQFEGLFILEQCLLDKELKLNENKFHSDFKILKTDIAEDFFIQNCDFHGNVEFHKSSFQKNFYAQRSVFRGGFSAQEIFVRSQLHFQGADFAYNFFAPSMSIGDYTDFSLCRFRGLFLADYSEFMGRTTLGGASFDHTSQCHNCHFVGNIDLNRVYFARIPMWKKVQLDAFAKMDQVHPEEIRPQLEKIFQ